MTLHVEWIPASTGRHKRSRFCKHWQVTELALFGSVLQDDFRLDSDIHVLVRFDPKVRRTLLDMARTQDELSRMLDRKVDVIERNAVERSRNCIRRKAIPESAEVFYAA